MSEKKTAAIHNLGCKVNAYESEAMEQLLKKAGYAMVPFDEKADVYIINTCTVTNVADRKSRQMLHRARKQNPEAVVVACGCYAQIKNKEALQDAAIDLVIGNDRKGELVDRIENFLAERERAAYLKEYGEIREYEPLAIDHTEEHTRAFLKVQDGCSQFCTYCIIPYARGRVRSRSSEEVVQEVKRLVESGCREVVLTGIHLSSYGVDMEEGEDLLSLIRRVHNIDGLLRIRLGSLEPRIVTEEFARELSALPKVCPHFHLSLQSGCDTVLKRMNRRYSTEEYREGCEYLRRYYKDPALTTDVITGFPGESMEEHQASLAFVSETRFFEIHVFPYSRRVGTKADRMPGQLSEAVKKERSRDFLELNERRRKEYLERAIGTPQEILLEECITVEGKAYWVGYTKEYRRIAVSAEKLCEPCPNAVCTAVPERFLNEETLLA